MNNFEKYIDMLNNIKEDFEDYQSFDLGTDFTKYLAEEIRKTRRTVKDYQERIDNAPSTDRKNELEYYLNINKCKLNVLLMLQKDAKN